MTRIATRIATSIAAIAFATSFAACAKDGAKDNAKKADDTTATALVAPTAGAKAKTNEKSDVGKISADQLDTLIGEKKVAIFDANATRVREEYGKIPTATLLSHYANYELSELPADKDAKLVFYCSNTQCGASKSSAHKAVAAGYSDVNVLPVGVLGWKDSGHKTEKAI